ncbi:hypothetical protein B566_EDAN003047 [Ephemera danica]|nr:hypothetical protein B566_EDAN003047 [Ephemera danica]
MTIRLYTLSTMLRVLMTCCLLGLVTSQVNDPHVLPGRHVMVHLFEWRWEDIATECETFLGPNGYAGVQTSPANENAIVSTAEEHRPWWERYQPLSYNVTTRSGNEQAFADMVARCNAVGVRVYVDAVLNHMTNKGNPLNGTGGNVAYPADRYFPAVPFFPEHTNRGCTISNITDPTVEEYHEVIDLGDSPIPPSDYFRLGPVTEFKYSNELGLTFSGTEGRTLANLSEFAFGSHWGECSPDVLSYKRPRLYVMGTAFHLAWTYGFQRIMSSFDFTDTESSPPMDASENTLPVVINPDGSCGNGWVCEHRWPQIVGMTCLSPGTYCDVISGRLEGTVCTGKSITVQTNGTALIEIRTTDPDGVLAFHVNAKLP